MGIITSKNAREGGVPEYNLLNQGSAVSAFYIEKWQVNTICGVFFKRICIHFIVTFF